MFPKAGEVVAARFCYARPDGTQSGQLPQRHIVTPIRIAMCDPAVRCDLPPIHHLFQYAAGRGLADPEQRPRFPSGN